MTEGQKVIEKTVEIRLPRWLARIVDPIVVPLLKRAGAKSTKRRTIYGEEQELVMTKRFGASDDSNLVAGEAGTKFAGETEELR